MSPPWMVEQAGLVAQLVYLGVVEKVTQCGPADEYFVPMEARLRVITMFKPASSAPPAVAVARYLASAQQPPEPIEGAFEYHELHEGDEAIVFAPSLDEDAGSFFVAPRMVEQIRASASVLASLGPKELRIMGSSESGRAAQLSMYEDMIAALQRRSG